MSKKRQTGTKRKIKVVKIAKLVDPKMHEVTLHVEADDPPPVLDAPVEVPIPDAWPDPVDYSEEHRESWSFWKWLLGSE